MEATLQRVDRLIEGMNGEDPEGARMFMSQLRENETLTMLECFEDMLSGKLPVLNRSSLGNVPRGSSTSMAYRVPPSEFLRVLLEGSSTRLGALYAVLQATGRGDLQGRAASLCISEVRMCLATSTGAASKVLAPSKRASSFRDSFQSSQAADRRIPAGHLRELAGVCLSFSVDFSPVFGLRPSGAAVRGTARGGEVANNRRILMLNALPAVLGACCAVANDEETDSNSSECDIDFEDEYQVTSLGLFKDGGTETLESMVVAAEAPGAVFGEISDERVSDTGNLKKNKGKSHRENLGGGRDDLPRLRTYAGRGVHRRERVFASRRGHGGLPERGEAILSEVIDTLLDRPWPPELALPLLVMFEEIYPLVEILGLRFDEGSNAAVASGSNKREHVWTRVRSRLMECVWMGGLDGSDFTGVLRQVCVMCRTDLRRRYQQDIQRPSSSAVQPSEVSEFDESAVEETRGTMRASGGMGLSKASREAHRATRQAGRTGGSQSWLACLRRLHAAVPPEWVSTAELVLEQTLHHTPDLAESLLDAIQDTNGDDELANNAGSPRGSCSLRLGPGDTATTAIDDLGLLLLLLREASPLRACSLPLLPDSMDRGRRAEDGVRNLLLVAARRGLGGFGDSGPRIACANRQASGLRGRENALASVKVLLQGVLCSRRVAMVRDSRGGATSGGYSIYGSSGARGGWVGAECSEVASERASQLLELALWWLDGGAGSGCNSMTNSGPVGGGCRGAVELTAEDLASETISAVFDAVAEARSRLLRALLSGMFDQSHGEATCAPSYLRAWEALMAQEMQQQCRRLTPFSQVISDALGRLTLLPRGRARRVVESMLPLADACPTQASALISLCRKCAAQGENKGSLLALHAVACILVWNARRLRKGGCGGFLDQDGMQEDLVAIFRRALEGGLQTATRVDTLHLLASKVAVPAPDEMLRVASPTMVENGRLILPPRGMLDAESPPAVDFSALRGLRELLTTRLFRFFAHKDELLDGQSSYGSINSIIEGGGNRRHGGPGDDGGDCAGGQHQRKGKQKAACRRQRVGDFRLVPLRLLEDGGAPTGPGLWNAQTVRSRGGVVPRDAIGHLLKCCWALVSQSEDFFDVDPSESAYDRVMAGPGKRAETEAIARVILGATVGGRSGQDRGKTAGGGIGVRTREGDALVAVVEFMEGGGGMETILLDSPSAARASASDGGCDDQDHRELPPPACHPGLVGSLPALAVVVTLAEALADCLLSGVSCPPAMPFLRPTPRYAMTSGATFGGRVASGASGGNLVLWAVMDVFTLLAAAARVAEGLADSAGFSFAGGQPSKARSPENLSDIIVSLPAETLGLSRGPDVDAGAAGVTAGDDNELEDSAGGLTIRKGFCGNPGGGTGGAVQLQCPLFSASSALVLAKEFLLWAATERGSPAKAVAEGWDAGVGVWLGLAHSVRALAVALEVQKVRGGRGKRRGDGVETTEGHDDESFVVGRQEVPEGSPSSEVIALAVFELRVIIGTPSAALIVLNPSSVPKTNSGGVAMYADSSAPATARSFSRRPPPGTMVTGFLKRMSERWKTHLNWGIHGAAPPRRTSARLWGADGRGRRESGGYGGDSASQNLRDEAEELFFVLWKELLRAERLALSTLLVGTGAGVTRRWATRAALLSAQRRSLVAKGGGDGAISSGEEPYLTAGPDESPRSGRDASVGRPKLSDSGVPGTEPEAGSGPARVVSSPKRRSVRRGRRQASTGSNSVAKVEAASPSRATSKEEENHPDSGNRYRNVDIESRRRRKEEREWVAQAASCKSGEGDEWGALGRLCRLAAVEMREGLENGLSVKLTQAYLDLVELLGNAALEHRHTIMRSPTHIAVADLAGALTSTSSKTSPVRAKTASSAAAHIQGFVEGADDNRAPGGEEDAGGILLSIVTFHCIDQVTLLKRLIRGAVRFDGVGAAWRHINHPVSSAATVAELEAREKYLSRENPGSIDVVSYKDAAASAAGRVTVRSSHRTIERCSQLLVHCVRWMQSRNNGSNKRGRLSSTNAGPDAEKGVRESYEKKAARNGGHDSGGTGTGGGVECQGCPSQGIRVVAELEDVDSDDSGDEANDASGRRGSADTSNHYSFRPDEVRFATSRECYAAMHVTLVEIEALLMAAGSPGGGASGPDSNATQGSSSYDADLANIVVTVSKGLREFFTPIEAAVARRPPAKRKRNEIAETTTPVPESALLATVTVASPGHGRKKHGAGGISVASGDKRKKVSQVSADLFPEHMKLLLMRVLERIYLVGRAYAVSAASVLSKSSSADVEATVTAAPLWMPSPPIPPTPPPPPTSKRRRKTRAAENVGKPGDQAGGGPIRCRKAGAGDDNKRGVQVTTARTSAVDSSSPPPVDSSYHSPPRPTASSSLVNGKKRLRRGRNSPRGVTDSLENPRSKMATTSAKNAVVLDAQQDVHLLLTTLLPTVAFSSGDSLRLMAEARAWAETRRARTQGAVEDPCRKRASTLLFKMDRCELGIGRAAQRARQFLDSFGNHVDDNHLGGVKSAKKRARGAGSGGGLANDGCGDLERVKEVTKCHNFVERALLLLLSGADTLTAWRRESSAHENAVGERRRKNDGSQGGKRQRHRRSGAGGTEVERIIPAEDDMGDEEGGEAEGRRSLGEGFRRVALGGRRKSGRCRIRSRNAWIDGWLAEGGEEGGDREDAFVDLEDFIED